MIIVTSSTKMACFAIVMLYFMPERRNQPEYNVTMRPYHEPLISALVCVYTPNYKPYTCIKSSACLLSTL